MGITRRMLFGLISTAMIGLGMKRTAGKTKTGQPRPIGGLCRAFMGLRGMSTSIVRIWPEGTVGPGGSCKLCPTCNAHLNTCMITVDEFVPPEFRLMFDLVAHKARTGSVSLKPDRFGCVIEPPVVSRDKAPDLDA